ncbi:MAG: RNA polymerase factor sigma-54 [Gammaproteobacteria bacterium]|nr:MAG: RNA polymerase factor sigma-54 [Gammaproteobacteria bacterium]
MKQSLQLRLGQHLTMTPQLQQAIRLLQLSSLELREEIQAAVESNPLLELAEEGEEEGAAAEQAQPAAEEGAAESRVEAEMPGEAAPEQTIPEELPVDTSWEELYDAPPGPAGAAEAEERPDWQRAPAEGLREHLQWQAELAPFSPVERAVAFALIDAIDESGYLALPLEEVREAVARAGHPVSAEEVEAVLRRVQDFDPPGVGARDLRECLLLQLDQLPPDTPRLAEARLLVDRHLELLGGTDREALLRRSGLDWEAIREAVGLIRSLNPRPGNAVAGGEPEYIVPDVVVRKEGGGWKVELNEQALPRVRLNAHYAGLVRRADSSREGQYLRSRLQEARWFLKSLRSRHETLLKVAACIVERQRGFLEHGEEAMRPMVLHDVAEALGLHESTVSRVTTRKYMLTPRGVYELKYFFSSHVATVSGGTCSATAIRALIKKLVAAEDRARPLSDAKIAEILCAQGIQVARRTVAKYREALAIPPSSERRRLV